MGMPEFDDNEPIVPLKKETRVDRHNNPIAAIAAPQFSQLLASNDISHEVGEPFQANGGTSLHTLKYPDPETGIEGSKTILGNSQSALDWYKKSTGKDAFAAYPQVKTNQDFAALPENDKRNFISLIAKNEGTSGKFSSPSKVEFDDNEPIVPLDGAKKDLKPTESPGILGTLGRKFTQSATAGISEPLAAAGSAAIEDFLPNEAQKQTNKGKGFKSIYKEIRDQQKQSLAAQEDANPVASTLGSIAGMVAPGTAFTGLNKVAGKILPSAAEGLSKANYIPELLKGAARGAGTVAAYEGINPDQDISGADVAVGGIAEPLTQLVSAGISKAAEKGKDGARKLMNKALGTNVRELKADKDIGQEALDRGLWGTNKSLLKKASGALDTNEEALQSALASKTTPINNQTIVDQLESLKSDLASGELNDTHIQTIDDLIDKVKTDSKYQDLTPSDANKIKRSIYRQVSDPGFLKDNPSEKLKILKTQGRGLKQAIEEVAPEVTPINKELGFYGNLKGKMLTKLAKDEAKQGFPLGRIAKDAVAGNLGLLFGGPLGAGLATGASELAGTTLGKSASAQALNKLAKFLAEHPNQAKYLLPTSVGISQQLSR